MAVFSATVFKPTVYKTGEVPPGETELLGGIMTTTDPWNTLKKSERKKQKQAIDIIEDVLAELRSHEETPKSAYIKLSEKSENNIYIRNALKQNIPHDFIYITENQIESILATLIYYCPEQIYTLTIHCLLRK